MIKTIKNRAKTSFIFAQDLCGCDVASKATWQSHADPRKHLRGAQVTRDIHIYIYSYLYGYSTYKHPIFQI